MFFRRTKQVEEPRFQHYIPRHGKTVVQTAIEIDDAVHDGTELEAACGLRWIPIAGGLDSFDYPMCDECRMAMSLDFANSLMDLESAHRKIMRLNLQIVELMKGKMTNE